VQDDKRIDRTGPRRAERVQQVGGGDESWGGGRPGLMEPFSTKLCTSGDVVRKKEEGGGSSLGDAKARSHR